MYDNEEEEVSVQNEKEITVLELPTIAENIMKFLPDKDLETCSEMSKWWESVINGVRNKRRSVYLISMPSLEDLKKDERIARDIIRNLWIQPEVAILFGIHRVSTLMSLSYDWMNCQRCSPLGNKVAEYARERCFSLMQEAKSEIESVTDHLPRKCTFLQMTVNVWRNSPHSTRFDFNSSALMLFPSNPEVQVQPFLFPTATECDFQTRSESLILSERKNSLNSNVKCVIAFTRLPDIVNIFDKDEYAKTTLKNYVDDDTIIVGAFQSESILSPGIAFAGKSVEVEWIPFDDNCKTCRRRCLSFLRRRGFNKNNGIAFLIVDLDASPYFVSSAWPKIFPKIQLIVTPISKIRYTTPKSICSLQLCKNCRPDSKPYRNSVIVIISFRDVNCRNIII